MSLLFTASEGDFLIHRLTDIALFHGDQLSLRLPPALHDRWVICTLLSNRAISNPEIEIDMDRAVQAAWKECTPLHPRAMLNALLAHASDVLPAESSEEELFDLFTTIS